MAVSLSVNLGGLTMKNPVTTASGTYASGREYAAFVDPALLGAVTTKGVSLNGWAGNDAPRIAETPSGMLNSIGLQNPGVEVLKSRDLPWLRQQDATVIVNVSGHSIDEYVAVVESLEETDDVDAYEVNISCPNVDSGGLTFGTDVAMVQQVVSECRKRTKRPLFVKLTPNVTDITEIAKAAEAAGADAISLINTLLGMRIDIRTKRPILHNNVGGLSGPAVFPVAVRMVWQVANAVKIPVCGMGGISTWEDAVEMMMAGASTVQVGAALFNDPLAAVKIIDGLEKYVEDNHLNSINDIVGAVKPW